MKNKKQHIYDQAANLFREKGYSATSMRELAVSVGLEPSSLYSHIRSKEEILRKICFDTAQTFTSEMEGIRSLEGSPLEKLSLLISLHIRTAVDNRASITVFNDEWRNLSEPSLSQFLRLRKDYENKFLEIIKDGMEQGLIKKKHPATLLYTVLSAVRWIHYWYHPGRIMNVEILEEEITSMILDGLTP